MSFEDYKGWREYYSHILKIEYEKFAEVYPGEDYNKFCSFVYSNTKKQKNVLEKSIAPREGVQGLNFKY